MGKPTNIREIPEADAVFWMDADGRWCNAHGRFENPKISAYFHSCIGWDDAGYFVAQEQDGVFEKVYFRVEDTAFFVFRVEAATPLFQLTLNTGEILFLDPSTLFVENDRLYVDDGGRRIRFTERAAMAMGPHLHDAGGRLVFRCGGGEFAVTERQ
jgi:hypothetical protein